MLEIVSIGKVKNKFKRPVNLEKIRQEESIIVIKPEYEEGLYRIEDNNYLQVVFNFHLSEGYKLKAVRHHGKVRGVFASRSPHRPSQLGITTVKLIERQGRKLWVKGLDAIDNTPVLDIKPYAPFLDESETFSKDDLKSNPRSEIEHLIETNKLEELLLRAGEIHGHFCPGLAMGVKAATYGLNKLSLKSDGMEDVLAIVETNSCFSDGVQYLTGCTFGNNALIYRDFGKTAVTITGREGKGLRLRQKNNNILEKYPDVKELFEKVVVKRVGTERDRKLLTKEWSDIAFKMLRLPLEDLFDIEEVKPDIPDYAPIFDDEFCDLCGEKIMAVKAQKRRGSIYCIPCANADYLQLDGRGLNYINMTK